MFEDFEASPKPTLCPHFNVADAMQMHSGPRVTIGRGKLQATLPLKLLHAWPYRGPVAICMFEFASSDHKVNVAGHHART